MGLILCESRNIQKPLYISGLGVRVYSIEELAYVIFNYPLLVMDDFVDDNLIDFIQNELKISLPTIKIDKEDVLFSILNATDYYSGSEIDKYRNVVYELKKLPKYEFYRQKGDLLFELGEFGKAIETYQKAITEGAYYKADAEFNYNVRKSIGNCFANLLNTDKAFESFKAAYDLKPDRDILKRIYFLTKYENIIGKRQEIMDYLDDRVDPSWDGEYESVLNKSHDSDLIKELHSQLNLDSVKRHNSIVNTLNKWKQNYRNMLH